MPKVAKNPEIDPTLPKIPLKLGAETYYLCFTFGAIAIAQAKLREAGIKINLLHALDLSTLDAESVVPLLYAALITHAPDISLAEVEKLVTFRNLAAVYEGLAKAYLASLAEPESDDPKHPTEPQPS
jgi:hypothetical protein